MSTTLNYTKEPKVEQPIKLQSEPPGARAISRIPNDKKRKMALGTRLLVNHSLQNLI